MIRATDLLDELLFFQLIESFLTQVLEQISVQQQHVFMHLVPFVQIEVKIAAVANDTLLQDYLFTGEGLSIAVGVSRLLVSVLTLLECLCLKFN